MSDWAYVAIAYTAVWGALALYAVVLARRVTQARRISLTLEELSEGEPISGERETNAVCDAPPAP